MESTTTYWDLGYMPMFMDSKELHEKIIGKEKLCDEKFAKLIKRPSCPKIDCGHKYLFPTKKFVEWLESQSEL